MARSNFLPFRLTTHSGATLHVRDGGPGSVIIEVSTNDEPKKQITAYLSPGEADSFASAVTKIAEGTRREPEVIG